MEYESAKALFAAAGMPLYEQQYCQLQAYLKTLAETNEKMNLTAITEPAEVWAKHFLDSAALLCHAKLPTGASCIDVGTGAGFPAMVLAVLRPDVQFTLLDSLQKRVRFLEQTAQLLGLGNVRCIHARAEEAARQPELREQFDFATARAVAALPVLAEYLLPYVKVGGKAVCWKGPAVQDELGAGKKAAFLLGGKLAEPIPVAIPGQEWQHLLLPIAKQTKTARQYPRKAGTPGKSPLGQTDKA